MFIAYLDESDTKAKSRRWQVVSAVIIPSGSFKLLEVGMAALPAELMKDRSAKFEEFHASEPYGGYGPFEGIEQERRFETISRLLSTIKIMNITIVYGAVDLDALQNEIYGSADPVDVCFRKCVGEIRAWAEARVTYEVGRKTQSDSDRFDVEAFTNAYVPMVFENLVLLIADECDPKIRNTLQKSFRTLRPRDTKITDCFHDDMYFGDSRFSIGIQLADLCSYFIARHLEGDGETEFFYEAIETSIFSDSPLKGAASAALMQAAGALNPAI